MCPVLTRGISLSEDPRERSANTLAIRWDHSYGLIDNSGIYYTVRVSYREFDQILYVPICPGDDGVIDANSAYCTNLSLYDNYFTTTDRFFTITGLTHGVEYTFEVTSHNECPTSGPTDSIKLIPGIRPSMCDGRSYYDYDDYYTSSVYTLNTANERVVCHWSSANPNGFDVIDYEVEVEDINGNFHNVVQSCAERNERNNYNSYNHLPASVNQCTLTLSTLR